MNMIQTVTGPVHPDGLGIVSLHEHVYSGGGPDLYADREDHSRVLTGLPASACVAARLAANYASVRTKTQALKPQCLT